MESGTLAQHYCIQADRIVRIEDKLDRIEDKLDRVTSADGMIGQMSNQLERLATLIANGARRTAVMEDIATEDRKIRPTEVWKWFGLSVLVLAVIIAALLGVNLPF